MNSLTSKFGDHLTWAQDPARYQLIINGIRAEQMYEVMDLERNNRIATSLQNRIFKGYQALSYFNQIEARDVQQVIEKAQLPILAMDEPESDTEPKDEEEAANVVDEKVV